MNNERELDKCAEVFARVVLSIGVAGMIICGSLLGCRLGTNVSHDPPIYDTNHVPRALYPGLLITFPNLPSPEVINLMNFAAAKRTSEKSFVIERYDRHNDLQSAATEQAYREGARVMGWRESP